MHGWFSKVCKGVAELALKHTLVHKNFYAIHSILIYDHQCFLNYRNVDTQSTTSVTIHQSICKHLSWDQKASLKLWYTILNSNTTKTRLIVFRRHKNNEAELSKMDS